MNAGCARIHMRPVDLIRKKRDGGEHSPKEISSLVDAFTRGALPDYQMSAWMMAVLLRGMSDAESAALTDAMMRSGQILDLREFPASRSTSIPPAASATKPPHPRSHRRRRRIDRPHDQRARPRPHRRHLGQTRIHPRFQRQSLLVRILSCPAPGSVAPSSARSAEIVPADKKMYALRDVTGTVECQALICASIMSKKLAEGIDALVLDVKTGSGAFMKRQDDAEHLAAMMVQTGRRMGIKIAALITDMDQPLGRAVGNSLEVLECLEILRGEQNPLSQDLRHLSLELSAWMFLLGGATATLQSGRDLAAKLLAGGQALAKFRHLCRLQGADPRVLDHPSRLPAAKSTAPFAASADGFIDRIDCEQVGLASLLLGRRPKQTGRPY